MMGHIGADDDDRFALRKPQGCVIQRFVKAERAASSLSGEPDVIVRRRLVTRPLAVSIPPTMKKKICEEEQLTFRATLGRSAQDELSV